MTSADLSPRRPGLSPARTGGDGRPRLAALVHDLDPVFAPTEMGTVLHWADETGFDVEVVVATAPMPDPATVDCLVVFGSDRAAYDDTTPWLAAEIDLLGGAVAAATPILGICFGGQLLARVLGGSVRRAERGEFGWTRIASHDEALVPSGPWLEFHYDRFTVPPGGVEAARTPFASQAFFHGPHLGVQFHPEITPAAFETWADSWRARGFDQELPSLGLDLDVMSAEIARRADASRAASLRLFDRFWTRAQAFRSGSMIA